MFTSSPTYQFWGDPVSQASAVAAHRDQMQAESQIQAANLQAQGQYLAGQQYAQGQIGAAQKNAAGLLGASQAQAGGNAYGAYAQGLGGVANAQSGLYGSYNQALSNLYGSQMSSMGQTEAARQIGLANLGTSGMSAAGQAAGSAMGAWDQNQSAWAKAMSDAQVAEAQAARAHGDRPTWQFRASRFSREAASMAAKRGEGMADPLGVLGKRKKRDVETPVRHLGRLERAALVNLDLDEDADAAKIRARYTELLKRLHPDAIGGDRSTEDRLLRVIRAYMTLQKAKLV
jgi:hypothetical protein